MKEDATLKLDIGGHTDGQGDPAKNQLLSENRAAAVKAYLVSKGIDESRLVSTGYGMDKPVADNKTATGRAQNRRVELAAKNY
jgi:OmpA-OmpF porin, OOP family